MGAWKNTDSRAWNRAGFMEIMEFEGPVGIQKTKPVPSRYNSMSK